MIYDDNAPLLVQRGYYPLPIAPPDFKPAKSPVRCAKVSTWKVFPGEGTKPFRAVAVSVPSSVALPETLS